MRARRLALVVLAGCDKLLSLDPISPMSPTVTGTFVERYATNRPDFTPEVDRYVPPTIAANATLDDGTTSPVAYHDDGTFSFPLAHPGQLYTLSIQTADAARRFQTASAQLDIEFDLAARPSVFRTPVSSSLLQIQLAGAVAPGSHLWLASTGQWTQTQTANMTAAFDFDWHSASPLSPPLGLLDASDYNDKLYIVDMAYSPTYGIASSYSIAIDLVDTATTMLTGNLAPPATTDCLAFTSHLAEDASVWASAHPDVIVNLGFTQAYAIPSYDLGAVGTLLLFSDAPSPPLAPTQQIPRAFGMPYDGSVLLAGAGVQAGRAIQLPATSHPFAAGMAAVVYAMAPSSASSTTCLPLDLAPETVAMPGALTVAGVPVTADATPVALPDGPVELAWSLVSPGSADYYGITLYELKAVSGYTVPHALAAYATTTASATFDASVFASGHSYLALLTTVTGYPQASSGDFATRSYPQGSASWWTYYFTVE